MEENVKDNVVKNVADELSKKNKTSKLAILFILGIGFLIFDYVTSGILLSEYVNIKMEWLASNRDGVIALAVTTASSLLAYAGFNIKGKIFTKFLPQILKVFGYNSFEEVKTKSDIFVQETKEEALRKIKDRISSNKFILFDITKKLNTPQFLTLIERDTLLELAKDHIEDLINDGVDYLFGYDETTPLLERPIVTETNE